MIALALTCSAVPAVASDMRVFFGEDDRQFVDTGQFPWSAIGKLYMASGGHCSGAVVAPRIVLTAAHCFFFDNGTDQIDRPSDFFAGLADGQYVAKAHAVTFHIPPQYDPIRHQYTQSIQGFDYAFVVLDREIGYVTGMFAVHDLTEADLAAAVTGEWTSVSQAGYSWDHGEDLTAHIDCPVRHYFQDFTMFHECDMVDGDSGSPMFIKLNGQYRIIGIVSAIILDDGAPHDRNLAVDARAFHDDLAQFISSNTWAGGAGSSIGVIDPALGIAVRP